MKNTTKRLARQVQQALLALPDPLLLTTIETWLKESLDLYDGDCDSDSFYEIFGYSIRSEETGRLYESLEDYFEVEPEADEITWQPPTGEALRTALEKMQSATVYHGVVALAGDAFRQKMFAASWGEPPDTQSDGYAFMRALAGYLALRKEAEDLSPELFEERFNEELEALAPPETVEDEAVFGDFSGFFTNERVFHFHVTFTKEGIQQHRNLVQALEHYDCTLSDEASENRITGSLSYIHWLSRDLRALARVQRLLNRWQRSGWITWTARKEKPPKRTTSQKQRSKGKRGKR
jgi:hypothetical protein